MKNVNKKAALQNLFAYIKKYVAAEILTVFLAAASVVASLYIPVLCGRAIDGMISSGMVDFDLILDCLIKIAILAFTSSVLQWIMNTTNNSITYAIARDVRKDAFDKILRLPLSYIDSHPHGETVSRIISDVDQFADGLLIGFTQFVSGVVTIICTLVFMLMINPLITLVVVLLTPMSLVAASFIAKKSFRLFRRQSEERGEITSYINEIISGEAVIKVYSKEDDTANDFAVINESLKTASLKAIFVSSVTNPATRFINNTMYACVCLFGSLAAISGGLTVGALTSFLAYANQYTKPFNEISGIISELQSALACAERIFAIIGEEEYSADIDTPAILGKCKGEVGIEHVDFSYDKEKPFIKDLNLSVTGGERIAIVGRTGCGKTTVINLLMRFYDTDSGRITVDGCNIKDIKRKSLQGSFGMVLQDTWLMNGTVWENIKMGREAADEDVIKAAKASHAHSFIMQLPDGYDTVIGNDFELLSQGQKQLLCIARVMLDIPDMLILDEATSSIDTRTELKIQEAFACMTKGRTSFIVAHRLSTIREADLIIVMENGRIVESGVYDELLSRKGAYAELWTSQFDSA